MRNLLPAAIGLSIALTAALPAPAAELRAGVARLFELGKTSTPTGLAAAREHYEQLKLAAPDDRHLDYAYGLVLMNQRRHRDALPLVASFADANPADLQAAATRLRLLVDLRRYGDALNQAATLAKRFANDTSLPHVEKQNIVKLLGMLVGFLTVNSSTVDAAKRVQATNEILASIGNAYVQDFDAGRRQVTERFEQLRGQRQAKQDERAKAATEQRASLKSAAEQNQQLGEISRELVDTAREGVHDSQHELSVLQQQLATIAQDRYFLVAQITTLEQQYAQLQKPVERTENREIVRGPNPTQESVTQSTTSAINLNRAAQAQQIAYWLAVYRKQVFDLDRRIMALQSRAAQVAQQGSQHAAARSGAEESLRDAQRRTQSVETQSRRLEAKQSNPPRLVTPEMQQFATYLPFDYRAESRRVLAWFDE